MTFDLTLFSGQAGDRNPRGWAGAASIASALGERLGLEPVEVGVHGEPIDDNWDVELVAAADGFRSLAERYVQIFEAGRRPLTALNRCAAAIATLPIVARYRPDAVVLWFDGHADINVPGHPATRYLGGIAFSASLGLWDSGFGAGVASDHAVLVGARDIDEPERELIDQGFVQLVEPAALESFVAGRPIYVHIDFDVLEPGQVPTEYSVPDGLTLQQLSDTLAALARTSEIVGVEVAEFEGEDAAPIVTALAPLLA